MRSETYQITLISLGVAATCLFAVFVYREAFPEYKIYQKDYVELEEFRSSYTGEPPPEFSFGVKQIVQIREDKGPAKIDRCISCHVALTFPHFSPTKLAQDSSGKIIYDEMGIPKKIPNPDYIFTKLDNEILKLENENRTSESLSLQALKVKMVDGHEVDMTKVLMMHPLIGAETRPFEFHSLDEYGCTSCHSGNGLGLTSEKAHGPIFDGQYEVEFEGPVLKFTETDELNDPAFSKHYNGKPGHELIFQTTPLFVGSLIQAKCVQCHQSTAESLKIVKANLDMIAANCKENCVQEPLVEAKELINSVKQLEGNKKFGDIDHLTQNFERGKNLFISQGCYACHRIIGLSRGGVGPELTEIGKGYPWAIKQKLVWPQGNLRNSTMPNYRLDHVELEDLMTFLLGQTGENKSVAETLNKIYQKEWESGQKNSFELPLKPSEIHDLRKSMTIFATEGCAACHRLKGFESNVGFEIEKNKPTSEELYKTREWFRKLIPESITGSSLVNVIEANSDEINRRIVRNVREGSILEEIEEKFPDVIRTFYTDFAYAMRAKNHEHLIIEEQDTSKKLENEKSLKSWKDLVQRVLMIYIQEYGLGRIIGPKPNWSGIYRSDEWLMQHFRNPSALIPNSIMPVFPFDDTKFYALTYMLDILGVKNRDETRSIWQMSGFNPEMAYQIHCAQCHGDNLSGNGPVSEWIYPIPKNLKNAEFLRNLTKENAVNSIIYGVKGTPMAPWGETFTHKPNSDGIPVLTKTEAESIVDWLFSKIAGENVISDSESVPKWQYEIEDVKKELDQEKETLVLDAGNDLFDIQENSTDNQLKKSYFIKQKYYTEENINDGKKFFVANCAVCHGKEGDGTGARGTIMQDAKPRNLINFDWLNTRDDLRLLRSIKYGVPGTSMSAWGELTSNLQRLQLVMFIRSLSAESSLRKSLSTAIYNAFDYNISIIENERSKEFAQLENLQKELANLNIQPNNEIEAIKIFKDKLKAQNEFKRLSHEDAKLVSLQKYIKDLSNIFQQIGYELIERQISAEIFKNYLEMIDLNKSLYTNVGGKLTFLNTADYVKNMSLKRDALIQILNQSIEAFENEKSKLQSKLFSDEKSIELVNIANEIKGYEKLKNSIQNGIKKVFDNIASQEKVLKDDKI